MVTEWNALGSAIYSRLSSATGSGTVTIYQDLAPEGTQAPYLIFQRMVGTDERTFNTKHISSRYMVKAISNQPWATEAERTYAIYEPYMDDAPLSITGYTLIRCRRTGPIHYQDPEMFWHCGGEFEVEVEKT